MGGDEQNGWGEWRRHVLLELEWVRKTLEAVCAEQARMNTEIALLKYKSSAWGALGAGVVIVLYMLIQTALKK